MLHARRRIPSRSQRSFQSENKNKLERSADIHCRECCGAASKNHIFHTYGLLSLSDRHHMLILQVSLIWCLRMRTRLSRSPQQDSKSLRGMTRRQASQVILQTLHQAKSCNMLALSSTAQYLDSKSTFPSCPASLIHCIIGCLSVAIVTNDSLILEISSFCLTCAGP